MTSLIKGFRIVWKKALGLTNPHPLTPPPPPNKIPPHIGIKQSLLNMNCDKIKYVFKIDYN